MSKDILDISMYLILAAVAVLVVMNAKNFSIAVGGGSSGVVDVLKTISGSNYGK